jgi:hypothetical protein
MLSLERILNNDRLLRAMTGLSRKAFEALVPSFREAYEQHQSKPEAERQRVKGEHAHAGIKRYQSVAAVYRNRVPDFDDRLMLSAAGLWNFYLDAA